MKIYTSLNIGEFHINNCEDYLIVETIGRNKKVIAVFDGCSMGKDSVFAAMLFGKILRKITKKKFYEEFVANEIADLKVQLREIVKELFTEVKQIKNNLELEVNELLATIVVGIIDTENYDGEFIVLGDGLLVVDGVCFDFDQGDKPDYLAYHLRENFEDWYKKQDQKKTIKNFKDLSITTDGIYSFKNLKNRNKEKPVKEIIDYLLINREGIEFNNFLERKIRNLKDEENHVVTDDLAIVRVLK